MPEAVRSWEAGYYPTPKLVSPETGPGNNEDLPEQIGNYVIRRELGSGGVGVVYDAIDPVRNLQVALKVLRPRYCEDVELRRQFYQEARAVAQLSHPSIVAVYEVGVDDPHHFMALEYVRGRTVDTLLTEVGRLDIALALDIARQIAAGLEAAHQQKIIHRDIKPQNIMVDRYDCVKVMDFGIAQVGQAARLLANDAAQVMGTPAYMAPEQWEGGEVDHRCDIYAFGALLYHIFTGKSPYEVRNAATGLFEILAVPIPDPRDENELVPDEVGDLVMRCLGREPHERPDSFAVILEILRDALMSLSSFGLNVPVAETDHTDLRRAIAAFTGTSGMVDEEEARENFIRASEHGNPVAEMWLADLFLKGACGFQRDRQRSHILARSTFRAVNRLADHRDPEATFILGRAYFRGMGVKANPTTAGKLFKQAADMGHIHALVNLGVMHDSGTGVLRDEEKAMNLWSEAARKGHAWAMNNLAMKYSDKDTPGRDMNKAQRYLLHAAERGFVTAMFNLGMILHKISRRLEDGGGEYQIEAVQWWREAAWLGSEDAMRRLESLGESW